MSPGSPRGSANRSPTKVPRTANSVAARAKGQELGHQNSAPSAPATSTAPMIASDFFGPTPIKPDQVTSSITTAPGFAARNGNASVDPLFVDAAHGDFRLRPGSPAIGKGYLPGG